MMPRNNTEHHAAPIDGAEALRAFVVAIGIGLKFAVAVFLAALLVWPDRFESYPRDEITFRPDRATLWAAIAFLSVGGFTFASRLVALLEKSHVQAEVDRHRQQALQPIVTNLRLGSHPSTEVAYFEIPNVGRYEIRSTRAASFATGSIGAKLGPLRVRTGQLFFDMPDVWREMDRGTIVATSDRLVFQGTKRRQEWKWHLVGDVVFDQHGLLVWPRSGKPIGLKCGAQPKLFAFIEDQLSN